MTLLPDMWLIVDERSPEFDAATGVSTTRRVLHQRTGARGARRVRLIAELVVCSALGRAPASVTVTFAAPSNGLANQWHAIAEAARLYAQLADTRGDLEMPGATDAPLECTPHIDGAIVTAEGVDALTCVACYFGNDVTETLL